MNVLDLISKRLDILHMQAELGLEEEGMEYRVEELERLEEDIRNAMELQHSQAARVISTAFDKNRRAE